MGLFLLRFLANRKLGFPASLYGLFFVSARLCPDSSSHADIAIQPTKTLAIPECELGFVGFSWGEAFYLKVTYQ